LDERADGVCPTKIDNAVLGTTGFALAISALLLWHICFPKLRINTDAGKGKQTRHDEKHLYLKNLF
jgi:hypothetical protein